MTQLAERTAWYVECFNDFVHSLNGASSPQMLSQRKKAIDAFVELGFPTTLDEEWRYTSLATLLRQDFGVASKPDVAPFTDVDAWRVPNLQSHLLVFLDGHFQPALSSGLSLPKGVDVGSLGSLLEKNNDVRDKWSLAPRGEDAFVELNTAFSRDGVHVHVGKGVRVHVPIEVLFITTSPNVAAHPRLWVRVEEGAQATLIERYVSASDSAHLTNSLAEFSVGENAYLDHYRVQNENRAAFHIANLHVREERHSVFRSTCFTLGSGLTRNHVHTHLVGEGVDSTLNGLYLVGGKQHVDNHTLIEHAQPHCQSHEFYKGILADKSTGVFRGQILVHQAAQKTDAYQANRNLLLSDRAEINTKPQLEIYADDVKCSHGATIGQLDEDAIFYLRSRGIGRAAARQVLTRAFAGEVVERIRLEPLRLQLEDHVGERLEGAIANRVQ